MAEILAGRFSTPTPRPFCATSSCGRWRVSLPPWRPPNGTARAPGEKHTDWKAACSDVSGDAASASRGRPSISTDDRRSPKATSTMRASDAGPSSSRSAVAGACSGNGRATQSRQAMPPGIDKGVLAIGEPRRYRDKTHLEFIASQPCLLCGRRPSDPHHLRFAQRRVLGRRVSDEFTVPLCRLHHELIVPAMSELGGADLDWIRSKSPRCCGRENSFAGIEHSNRDHDNGRQCPNRCEPSPSARREPPACR